MFSIKFLHDINNKFLCVFFWLIILLLLILRIAIFFRSAPKFSEGTTIRIRGNITTEPLRFENSQYLNIKGFKIYLPKYPEYNYGDSIQIEGVLQNKVLKDPKVLEYNKSEKSLYKLRERLIHFYQKYLPYRHASLVAGVVLGSKESIDAEFWEKLKETGTVHVVVASGMNVSIVAKFLISFLILFLPRKKAIPMALTGIWSYSILSGFGAPIVRASIMGSLTFVAQELGRLYYAGRALIFTAVLMLFLRPEWIADLGFILSFVATASIMLLDEPIRNLFKGLPGFLRSDFSASISAQIGVAPILYASFGQFNLLSPLFNIAVLWTIPIITIIGMASGVIGLVFVPLGRSILYLTYPFTSWFIFCTTII